MFQGTSIQGFQGWVVLGMGFTLVGLLAAIPVVAEEEQEEGAWTGEVALSVNVQTGSVDTFAGSLDATTERKWTVDVLSFRLNGVYGRTRDREGSDSQDQTSQNSQSLSGKWKRTLHERFFWNTAGGVSRDTTQDREARARIVTGPGYRFWEGEDADKSYFDTSAGLGYRYELYDGNTDPNPTRREQGFDRQYSDVVAAFDYKNSLFEDRIEYSHTGSVALPVNDVSGYIIATEIIASVPLTGAWVFRTSALYEYVNDVPDDRNPSTFRLALGLGYKF